MLENYTIPLKPATSPFNDEQWQAIHQKGSNILVAASAGSGKTTVLIERIMNHIVSGWANIDELLVVTFTEAAANEMKERMENRLKEAVSTTLDRQQTPHLLYQLNALPTAHIRTLHSFCLQVIQQFFYIIEMNPAISLMTDETQKAMMYEESWQKVIESIYVDQADLTAEANTPPLINQADYQSLMAQFTTGRDDQSLQELIIEIYHFAMANPEPKLWLEAMVEKAGSLEELQQSELFKKSIQLEVKGSALAAIKALEEALEEIKAASQTAVEKYVPLLEKECQAAKSIYQALLEEDLEQVIEEAQTLSFDRWPSSRAKALEEDLEWIEIAKNYRDRAKEALTQIGNYFPYAYPTTAQIEEKVLPTIEKLQQLTIMFHRQLKLIKGRENIVDYTDLEHLTLEILAPYDEKTKKRYPSPAAHYYQKLFKEVLVDEYQDINEIQAAILSWLSHENEPDTAGNLFMVGDVKQSIYAFRMAEPSLFLKKYQNYQEKEDGQLIILDKNYRSRFDILNFTNYVFERLMDPSFGEMEYGTHEALAMGNSQLFDGGDTKKDKNYQIEFLLHTKETDDSEDYKSPADDDAPTLPGMDEIKLDKSIEAEAFLIAQDIQSKLRSGYQIYDKKLGQNRPMTFKDIVVLSATRAVLAPLQEAFSYYQIPLATQAIETYFQRQEIQLMVSLLKLIDNPIQDIPLVAILRSYFVGLDDEALSQIRIYHPGGNFYEAGQAYLSGFEAGELSGQLHEGIYQKLAAFRRQLRSWRQYSQTHVIEEVIWTIYQDTFFLDYVAGLDNGPQRQANLHAFYQKAKDFSNQAGFGLYSYIRYIERMIEHDQDLAEPIILEADQNEVRAMTIHASKGQEFPVVYLMNAGRRFNIREGSKTVVATKHHGVGLNYYDAKNLLVYQSLSKTARQLLNQNAAKAEQMRLLYVALTRCEQKLMVVGTINSEEKWLEEQEETRILTGSQQLEIAIQERSRANNFLTWLQQTLALYQHQAVAGLASLDRLDFKVKFFSRAVIEAGFPQAGPVSFPLSPENWLKILKEKTAAVDEVKHPAVKRIEKLMTHQYPFQLAAVTASYQSVSELKRLNEEPPHEHLSNFEDRRYSNRDRTISNVSKEEEGWVSRINEEGIHGIRYTQDTFNAPGFMTEDRLDAAQIGTINHFFMQELDFKAFQEAASEDYLTILNQQAATLLLNGKMTEAEREVIYLEKISHFLQSKLGQELIQRADDLERERAFSYLIQAGDLFAGLPTDRLDFDDDRILVHGVIDSYVVIPGEGFILIDFKTDRFRDLNWQSRQEQIEELRDKYLYQISLYTQALKSNLKMPCIGAYIVALDFEEVLSMDPLIKFYAD